MYKKNWFWRKGKSSNEVSDYQIGFLKSILGCWHRKGLSRPFVDPETKEAYRVCLECGARRAFDQKSLKTFGPFYYPPAKFPSRKG
jgi:hypothetical protein